MRRIDFLVMCLLMFSTLAAFSQLEENFSDGNFTSNPSWLGNTDLFTVNTSGQLQTIGTVAGQAALYTSFTNSNLDEKEWQFFIRQTFAGSDNNQSRVYLTASAAPIAYTGNGSAGVEGYFLRFGEGGSSDAIKLFKDAGTGTPIEVAACTAGAISASFTARVKVTRSSTGQWTIFADYTGGTAFVQEATTTDTQFNSSSNLGVICTYTASNADNFFFDDFYFGDIIVDTTPPTVISANATSATTLEVLFSEAVSNTATTTSNFQVNGSINPTSAVISGSNPALVTLTFTAPFEPNVNLLLNVSNIQDLNGNTILPASIPFLFFVPASPNFRSVVFNEILADPTPTQGLPDAEFIELFNPTNEVFNLENWVLVNSTTPKTLPSYNLTPNSFVILTDANNVGLFTNAIGISSFTALTNSTDSLTLIDNLGNIIDILVYSDDWFITSEKVDGGWTLEQINPLFPCSTATNWSESNAEIGGTPAAQNSVYNEAPDTASPSILNYGSSSANSISITFNETMEINASDFIAEIQPSLGNISFDWINSNTLSLQTEQPFGIGIFYTIQISGPNDCSGNELDPATIEFIIGFEPEENELIITEFMAAPSSSIGAYRAEYVEIFNKSNRVLDITDINLNSGSFLQQRIILPNSYLTIANVTNVGELDNVSNIAYMLGFPGLTNSGTTLTLSHPSVGILDEVNYSDDWYNDTSKDDGGWSLELINPNDPCSNKDNWAASINANGGTPGEQNSVYDDTPDTTGPQIVNVYSGGPFAVIIEFDEPLSAASLFEFFWIIDGEQVVPSSASFTDNSNTSIVINISGSIPSQVYNFSLPPILDCWGNASTNLTGIYAIAEPAAPGDLIINEILSDPFTGGSDFIEIYNNSNKVIGLIDWALASESDGELSTPDVITEQGIIILPKQYIVLTEDGSELTQFYPFTKMDRVLRIPDMPTYNNTEGTVVLIMPDGSISDRVAYTEEMHFVLLEDLDGVSLERIDPARPASDVTNWGSAAESQGFATPGYQNSQALAAILGEEDINVFPEIFSPDNDGFQDVVTFTFQNTKPGMVGNIYIFDSNGRQVLHLLKNSLIGENSSVSWDGRNTDNGLAPIGIYIVYIEVFDENGNTSKIKKTCVLAHQLD
ncbi:MAG: lamin tail domain-containing protein [Flavobacteriales bacterium]|jgi:hypothetical protein